MSTSSDPSPLEPTTPDLTKSWPQQSTPPPPAAPPTVPPAPGGRITVSAEDLATDDVSRRVSEMLQAQQVALVRDVGTAADQKGSGALRAIMVLGAGGLVGGILAFALERLGFSVLNLFEDNTFATNLAFTFILAFCIGVVIALADALSGKSWAKVGMAAAIAIPVALVAALLLGLIAHLFYTAGTEWLYNNAISAGTAGNWTDAQFADYVTLRLHPLRGGAWLMVGIAAGIAAGAPSRSWKRLGVAALGGAVGGFLGGFVFDFIPGEMAAQFVGIALLGLLIGAAMGLAEQAAKTAWIEIVSGGLAGKQFILYKPSITIGSSPTADVTLIKDPSVAPVAATLDTSRSEGRLSSALAGVSVVVNGSAAPTARVVDGDILTFGSTQIRFRQKASSARTPGALKV